MKKTIVKTAAVVLALTSILVLAGCSKVGKKTTYKATDKDGKNSCISGAYIRLNKGWSTSKGNGYVEHVYNNGKFLGWVYSGWTLTGEIEYKNSNVTFKSGKFIGKSFNPSFTVLDKNANKIKLMGKTYKA